MSNIRIDIASEFKDKGFKKAEKATTALDRSFKQLGATLAATLSVRQIVAFGRASVKAFAQDEQAARRLTSTLNNMGLAFEDPRVKAFIAELETTTGVLDDNLRPAMQRLLTTTGSVTKAQELLTLALDVSAGSGQSLETVTSDLARAYTGQARGLTKYSLGLTQAQLKNMSFLEIQEALSKQFSGQNAAFLDTYAGKLSLLNVAYANLEETIGGALLQAFSDLSGEKGIYGATQNMEQFGRTVAYTIGGTVSYIKILTDALNNIGSNRILDFFIRNHAAIQMFQALFERGQSEASKPRPFRTPMTISGSTDSQVKIDRARALAAAEEARRQKRLDDMRKKAAANQAKNDKERSKRERQAQQLRRAGTVFDMEAIQLVAALQNRVTEENRLRLTALLAIQNDNAEAADKLTQAVLMLNKPALENLGITLRTGDNATDVINKIINAQTRLFLLNTGIANLPKAKNPFEDWDSILDRLLGKINQIKNAINGFGQQGQGGNGGGGGGGTGGGAGGFTGGGGGNNVTVTDPSGVAIQIPGGNVANPFNTFTVNGATIIANSGVVQSGNLSDSPNEAAARQRIADIFATIGTFGAGGFNAANVTVNVAGNVMSNDDLIQVITEGLYEVQKRGQSITLNAVAL